MIIIFLVNTFPTHGKKKIGRKTESLNKNDLIRSRQTKIHAILEIEKISVFSDGGL